MQARRNPSIPLAESALLLTFFLLPWIGVGLGNLLLGRSLGTGAQPALVSGGFALLCFPFLGWRGIDRDGERMLVLLCWTVLGAAAVWGLDEMGLGGEAPWSKTLKQLVQLLYFFALAAMPALLLTRVRDPRSTLHRWESAASAGLLLASVVGLYFAAAYYLDLPGREALGRILGSNPSIASGSDELYLGRRFVGIARVRSGAAEPLYFGSYLLCVLPATVMGWNQAKGWGRVWRMVTLVLGFSCAVLTFSRGVYLGLFLLAILMVWGVRRGVLPRSRRKALVWSVAGLIVASSALAALFSGTAPWQLPALMLRRMNQSFAGHDLSNLTRLASWRAAWLLFLQDPLQGVGWGAYGFWFYRVGGPTAGAAVFAWPVTNSFPLRILAETGAVGALLWALALWRPLSALRVLGPRGEASPGAREERLPGSRGGESLNARGDAGRDAASFVLAATVAAMLLQLTTFSQLNLPHLWLCAGISAALARAWKQEG